MKVLSGILTVVHLAGIAGCGYYINQEAGLTTALFCVYLYLHTYGVSILLQKSNKAIKGILTLILALNEKKNEKQ